MKTPNFKNILSHIHLPKRTEFRTISAKARHDWKLIVVFFITLSLCVMGGNFYLFKQIDSGKIFDTSNASTTSASVVSKKNLEDTVQFFRERQARFEDLKTIKPSVPDPSL